MQVVFDIVIPVFGLVMLGYGATKMNWFSLTSERGLATFVFDFAIPLMLFRSLAKADLPESIPWGFFGTYYLSAYGCFLLGLIIARFVFKRDFGGQVITGFGSSFSNTVLLGLPLILTTFGDEATFPFFLILSVHGLGFFSITTLLLEVDRNKEAGLKKLPKEIANSVMTNPVLMAIIVGLAFNLIGLSIPKPVDDMAAIMQQAVTPCSLFALGASLTHYGFAGRLTQSAIIVSIKIMLMPFVVYMMGTRVFDVPPLWMMVAVLMAAQPTGVMTYIFSQRYKTGEAIATTSIFLSTALSIFTLTAILYLLDVR